MADSQSSRRSARIVELIRRQIEARAELLDSDQDLKGISVHLHFDRRGQLGDVYLTLQTRADPVPALRRGIVPGEPGP